MMCPRRIVAVRSANVASPVSFAERTTTLLLAVTICLGLLPQVARAQADDDILQTGRRLLAEERRQLNAQRRIKTVVRHIDWLLADLASNQRTAEAGGEKIASVNQILKSLGNTNVPKAAGLLRTARADVDRALPHINGADQEIELIIKQLDKALDGASAALADDMLLKELREVIKDEELRKRQTSTWGKKVIIAPATAKVDQGRLGRAQQSVISRYREFFYLLAETRQQADGEAKKRFAAAEQRLHQGKPENLLAKAIENIALTNAIAAVANQEQALVVLRAAEKILAAEEDGLSDLLKELEQILAEQKKLKKDVEASNRQQFVTAQSQFEAKQLEIGNDVDAWVGIEQLAGEALEAPLRDAKQAIAKARGFLAAGAQPKAVEAQIEAIAALERALAIVLAALEAIEEEQMAEEEQQGEEQQFGQEAAGDDGADGFGDDAFAADAFGADAFGADGFGADGFGADGFGADGAGAAGAEGAGVGEGAGAGAGVGAGAGAGQGQGQGTGSGKGSGPGQPTPFRGDPKDLEESFAAGTSSTVARGEQVLRKGRARDVLSRRRRSAAIQKYVQQLPPEFRRQVADYFEALAE